MPRSSHTPSHIALFDQRDGTLIAGDAFQGAGGIAVSGTIRPLFPFPAMATWYKLAALQSARRLAALSPSRLAVGHGRVLESPGSSISEAIRVAAIAASRLVALVLRVLDGYGLERDDALHAVRCIRSVLHGFVYLEAAHGFGLPLDREETFRRLIDLLVSGLRDIGQGASTGASEPAA